MKWAEKSALIYDKRKIYAASIKSAFDNMNVRCAAAESEQDLQRMLCTGEYKFIFTSYELYSKSKNIFSKRKSDFKTVILSESWEKISEYGLNVLPLPVYSATLANFFNNVSADNLTHDSNRL